MQTELPPLEIAFFSAISPLFGSYYGQNHPRPKKSDANLRKIIPKWAFGWPSTKKEDKSRAGRPKDQGE